MRRIFLFSGCFSFLYFPRREKPILEGVFLAWALQSLQGGLRGAHGGLKVASLTWVLPGRGIGKPPPRGVPLHQARLPEGEEGLLHGALVPPEEAGQVLRGGLVGTEVAAGGKGEEDGVGGGRQLSREELVQEGIGNKGVAVWRFQMGPADLRSHGPLWAAYPRPWGPWGFHPG